MRFFDLDSALLRHHPLTTICNAMYIYISRPKILSILERIQYYTTLNDKMLEIIDCIDISILLKLCSEKTS